jgi:predicted O-methyltransferase YrrM
MSGGPARGYAPGTARVAAKRGRRGHWRRTWFGLQTALGLARRGWFIPHRHAGQVTPAGRRPAYAAVEALFEKHRSAFAARLDGLAEWRAALHAIGVEPAPAPRWSQDWFPRLDAAMAYAMVRTERPNRILEVGSGHSTRFLLRALADGGLEGAVMTIDPAPRAALENVGGERLNLVRRTLQKAGTAPFEALCAGDMLLIDSSHVLMPGSDVDLLFGHVLPALPVGVLVHLHDVFLPDDYPAAWAWRGYNEQLAVLPMLLGGGWEPLFAARWVATRMAEAVAASAAGGLPLPLGAWESGLWLRRTDASPGSAGPITSG